jgi:hypothetical protein
MVTPQESPTLKVLFITEKEQLKLIKQVRDITDNVPLTNFEASTA